MPNPGTNCNSTNNFTNFCFSTESSNNINVCGGMSGLSGTYGSYGAGNIAVNWGLLNGCDAMNGGWSVQVYDCVGLDTGSLTDATITFTGTDLCGASQTVTYSTPPGFSSPINDNSCNSASASIFTVSPAVAPPLLACNFGFEWSSDPYVYIADSTASLNINLTSLTDAAGNPVPWQNISFTLSTTISCDSLASENDCFGGNGSDTELYVNIPQTLTTITDVGPVCIDNGTVQLEVDMPGGTWSGPGIVDAALGVFDPTIAGEGSFSINYTYPDPCVLQDDATISVEVAPNLTLELPEDVCVDALPFSLVSSPTDGIFSGLGITDPLLGTFDPAIAGEGTHTISMTTSTVCPINLTDDINVQPLPILDVSANADVCPGDDVMIQAEGAESYLWTPATYLSADNIDAPFVSLEATTTYTVEGTSEFGCTSQGQVTLTLLGEPSVGIIPPAMACPGAPVLLTAEGSAGSWTWSLASGGPLGVGQVLNSTFDQTTVVEVEVTDNCQNTATAQMTVPIEATPSIYAGMDEVLCTGASTQLTANIVGNYNSLLWTSLNGSILDAPQLVTIQTSAEGLYTATITTALGCEYSDDIFVDVVPLPTVNAGDDTAVCGGQPHSLNATGAATYSWSPATGLSNPTIASTDATINAPVTYTVTGVDGNGCVNTDQISLTIIPSPQLNAQSVAMICPGSQVLLQATGSMGSYNWSPATGLNTVVGDAVIASPMVTTQYTVTLTDLCGVQLSLPVNVPVEQLYTASAGSDIDFCEGEEATLLGAVTGSNPTISWYNGGTLLPDADSETLVTTVPGTYSIQVQTPLGCMYDDAVIVNEIAYPTFYLPDTISFCQGTSATLTIPGVWDALQWSNGSVASTINVASEGDYSVSVTNDGCSTEDEVHVYRVDLPVIQLGPNVVICQGETATLSCGYSGQWSTGASGDSIVVATAGTYTFEYTEEGCSVSDFVNVSVNPLPYVDAVTTQYGCMNEPFTITINDYSAGSYQWSDGSEGTNLTVDQPGDYWFMVTNSCGSEAATIAVVLEDCSEALYVPNCFTPDNDGINDAWKVVARHVQSMKTCVLNRWGEVVFESNDPDPVWIGNVRGSDTYVPDGLYFFRIEFERRNGENDLREGTMFVIR
jgi:gliding motility-associated-like protein